ncbi:MAG TPA: folate-binding protein [Orrella sp.]
MSRFTQPVQCFACTHLSVFSAAGPDTETFLQSQLAQDMQTVTTSQAALAGFCTAQGRLWASMLLLGTQQGAVGGVSGVVGVACADVMDSFLKRLRMFVLRSKVTLEAPEQPKVFGLVVSRADLPALNALCDSELSDKPWQVIATPWGQFISMPSADADVVRYQLLASDDEIAALSKTLGESWQPNHEVATWRLQDMRAGIGWIQTATQDLFIAQTLNLDLLDGVSFTKGCYPGQEVVARAHYRGTVKRRMHLANIGSTYPDLTPGMDVFEANEPDNPVGRLIDVVTSAGNTWVLFEAPFKTLKGEPLRAGSASGPSLQLQSLPYSLEQPTT